MFQIEPWCTVVCHPYGTARVNGLFEIDRTSAEWKAVENELAKRAGVSIDNHVVYTVSNSTSEIHFWCTDMWVQVGSVLIEER